ncbi:MAG TPA: FCD domain-containing protein [Azospirillum sp.]
MGGAIKPAKLADAIADHLQKLILEGTLRPGEKLLPERELSEKLQVSRPPLRDALAKLEKLGLLVTEHSGTHVAHFLSPLSQPLAALLQSDPRTTFDYLEYRGVVEGAAARMAAERATEADRQAISECIERMRAAHGNEDSTEEASADADLHILIYEATHNTVMLHLMRALSDLLRNDVFYNRARLYSQPRVRETLLEQHLAIAEAVVKGDGDAARAAAEAHVVFTHRTLEKIRDDDARLEVSLRRIGRNELVDAGK